MLIDKSNLSNTLIHNDHKQLRRTGVVVLLSISNSKSRTSSLLFYKKKRLYPDIDTADVFGNFYPQTSNACLITSQAVPAALTTASSILLASSFSDSVSSQPR